MTNTPDNKKNILGRLKEREKGVRTSAQGVQALFERLGGPDQARLTLLWKQWEAAMGEHIASLSYPLGHKEDTLTLGADDSMALQELSLLAAEIVERANAFVGREVFSSITVLLRQGRRDLAQERPVRETGPYEYHFPLPRVGRLLGKLDPDSPVTRCYEAHVARSRKK